MSIEDRKREAAALYEGMSSENLTLLRSAFEADLAHAKTLAAIRFCEDRIAMIDAELARRSATQ